MVNGVKPRLESGVELVHAVAGRVRLRILDSSLMALLVPLTKQLQQQKGVKEVRLNERTGSLVIAFDPDMLSQPEMLEVLKQWGIDRLPVVSRKETAQKSESDIYSQTFSKLISFIPPIVGILTTRWLAVSGWRAILTYLIATELTRQVMKQLELEQSELPQKETFRKLEYERSR